MNPHPLIHPNLRRFAGSKRAQPAAERCEVCASTIAGDHRHLLEIDSGRLLCSCRPCWLLFADSRSAGGKLRAVPDRVVSVPAACVTAAIWEALQIPIALVFFRFRSLDGRATAFYPSPAGATESQLPLDAWPKLLDASPSLRSVAADVEAVLVRGTAERQAWYIVPIDACYELIGRIRTGWRGFSGGDELQDDIERFFAALDAKSASSIGGSL
jgi:hypothetical protein